MAPLAPAHMPQMPQMMYYPDQRDQNFSYAKVQNVARHEQVMIKAENSFDDKTKTEPSWSKDSFNEKRLYSDPSDSASQL